MNSKERASCLRDGGGRRVSRSQEPVSRYPEQVGPRRVALMIETTGALQVIESGTSRQIQVIAKLAVDFERQRPQWLLTPRL